MKCNFLWYKMFHTIFFTVIILLRNSVHRTVQYMYTVQCTHCTVYLHVLSPFCYVVHMKWRIFFTLVIHKNRVHLNCTIWYWTHMQRIWILIKLKNKFNSIPRCTRSLSSNTRPLLIQANSRDRIFQTAVFIWSWIPSFLNKTQYHFRFRVNCMFEKFSPISRHVLN